MSDIELGYIDLLKQSQEYRIALDTLVENGTSQQEAEKRAVFSANSGFCFYYLKDKCKKELAADHELSECIEKAIIYEDERTVVKNLDRKMNDLKYSDIDKHALAGIYQFMAEQIDDFGNDTVHKLDYLAESFKLWPENDLVYDQLNLFCKTIMKKQHYVGEECTELEMAKHIKRLLREKRPDKQAFDIDNLIEMNLLLREREKETDPDESDYDDESSVDYSSGMPGYGSGFEDEEEQKSSTNIGHDFDLNEWNPRDDKDDEGNTPLMN